MKTDFHYDFTLQTTANRPVIFSAFQLKVPISGGEAITFSEIEANVGDGMNPETGVFTTPVSGNYSFSLSAAVYNYCHTQIRVYKNGQIESIISDHNPYHAENYYYIGFTWSMSLLQNDQIYLKRSSNDFDLVQFRGVRFNGQLLK